MENKKLRKSLNKYGEENDVTFKILDNPYFDNSIIGITECGRLIYDYDKMIDEFANDNQCTYEESMEFIDYNTVRAIPYFGDGAPIIIYNIEEIKEKY